MIMGYSRMWIGEYGLIDIKGTRGKKHGLILSAHDKPSTAEVSKKIASSSWPPVMVHTFPGDSIVAFWFFWTWKTDNWLIFWTQAGLELLLLGPHMRKPPHQSPMEPIWTTYSKHPLAASFVSFKHQKTHDIHPNTSRKEKSILPQAYGQPKKNDSPRLLTTHNSYFSSQSGKVARCKELPVPIDPRPRDPPPAETARCLAHPVPQLLLVK